MLLSRADVNNVVMTKTVAHISKPATDTSISPEMEQLKREVRVIKAEMLSLKAASVVGHPDTQNPPFEMPGNMKYRKMNPQDVLSIMGEKNGIFCYKCREDGHLKRDCDGEENHKSQNVPHKTH